MATTFTFPENLYPQVEPIVRQSTIVPYPDSAEVAGTESVFTWNTDLTQVQYDEMDDIIKAVKSGMTLEFYQSIKQYLPTLRNFLQNNNPTNAQVVSALKAHIRVSIAQLKQTG